MPNRAPFAGLLAAALIAGTALGSPAGAHPPGVADQDQPVAHEIEALREAIVMAIERKDVNALRILYADSFTHTHGSGRVDGKDTRIVSLLAAEPAIENAPVDDLRYRVLNDHAVIVSGRSPILNVKENQYYDFRWMAVYARIGPRWQLAASQATRLPDPPRRTPGKGP